MIDNYDAFDYRNYEDASIQDEAFTKGTFIMSDSPETVNTPGVLYEDVLNGEGRILLHHLNMIEPQDAKGEKQRLALIAANPTDKVLTVKIKNKSIQGPATDILRVGQKTLYEYLKGSKEETLTLQAGEKSYIYEKNWNKYACISGLMDIETDGEVAFIVAALSESESLDTLDAAVRHPFDGVHISGTFDTIGVHSSITLEGARPSKLLFGDKSVEEWVNGYDKRTMEKTQNKGNFGVSYYVTLTAKEDTGVILNSRGAGIMGAIKWDDEVYNVPTKGFIGMNKIKGVNLGLIKKGETKTLEYMLPNGSSAPILIAFVPKSYWETPLKKH